MKKILHHKARKDHYHADACVIWCFDNRFSMLLENFKKKMKFKNIDLVKVAGGAKVLATPQVEPAEKYILGQIEKSIKLHHTKCIVLMVHSGCGAYGKKFKSIRAERKFYLIELRKAKRTVQKFLKQNRQEKPVDTYYADFSALWRT